MLPTHNAATVFAMQSKAFPAMHNLNGWGSTFWPLHAGRKISARPLVCPFPRESKHALGAGVETAAGTGAGAAGVLAVAATVGRCTYGERNSLWLSQELERLLSVQRRPGDGLVLTRGQWSWDLQEDDHYQLIGKMQFHNITERFEIFVPEVHGKIQLLARISLNSISSSVQILPRHPDGNPAPRKDGYWPAYIIRAGESTSIEVSVDISSKEGRSLKELQAARLEMEYISYGPHGRSTHVQHVILPLQYRDIHSSNTRWRNISARPESSLLPIHTHLLSHLDDPLEVLRRYVLPHAEAGDVIAIGETPLAIMQGRFRHPRTVQPGLVAGLACRLFHPTSSLATACGMQALVDISGRLRVVLAVFIAVIARILGQRGVFYQVAGEQARLIDDITGTLPPYDQFITLGPVRVQATVNALRAKTGCEVAIVDVNDLKKVHILAASHGVDHHFLKDALIDNPAGNADEQTPIILLRKRTNSTC
ncbi:unnamed protein product [Calypogeia fissa]